MAIGMIMMAGMLVGVGLNGPKTANEQCNLAKQTAALKEQATKVQGQWNNIMQTGAKTDAAALENFQNEVAKLNHFKAAIDVAKSNFKSSYAVLQGIVIGGVVGIFFLLVIKAFFMKGKREKSIQDEVNKMIPAEYIRPGFRCDKVGKSVRRCFNKPKIAAPPTKS